MATPILLTLLPLLPLVPGPQDADRLSVLPESLWPPGVAQDVAGQPDLDAGKRKVTLYDVADLSAPAPPAGLEELLEGTQSERLEQTERLAELILDKRGGGMTIGLADAPAPGVLRVEGDEAGLAFASRFLDAQRAHPEPLIVTMSLIEVPRGGLADLGVEGSSALFEEPGAHAAFREGLLAAEGVDVISTPRVAVSPRQRADLEVSTQVAYVKDYELQLVEPGSVEILDPIIDVIEEGTSLSFDAVPMPGGVVELDVEVVYSQLERPIPTVKKRFGAGEGGEYEIGLPEVETVRLHSLLALRPGTAALFASAAPDASRDFAVLLHLDVPPRDRDPVVEELFDSMLLGTYAHRWFPPLEWSAVPALVERAESSRSLHRFPSNPFSSQSQAEATEGLVALWLIEGLCEEGRFGSLNPLLVQKGRPLDASLAEQRRLQVIAAAAYRRWWGQARNLERAAAARLDPLAGTGLSWYGSVRR